MSLAKKTSELSYAPDRKVGAVLVCKNESIFFSYNGTVPGTDNSTVDSAGRTLSSVLHAETAVIGKASKAGVSTLGSTLYVTLSPCIDCAKMIYLAGISRVVYLEPYKCLDGINFLRQSLVLVNQDTPHCQLLDTDALKHTCLSM